MGKREDNKRKKREALEAEGLKLFLEHGYDRTSIEQIAAAAGVARGTFYLYFEDKLALFLTLVDRWYDLVIGLMLEDVAPRLATASTREEVWSVYEEMGVGLALIAITHHDEFLVTFRETRQPGEAGLALRERELEIQRTVVAFTEDVIGRGLLDVDSPKLAVLLVFGAVERLYYEFLLDAELPPAEDLAKEVVGMFRRMMNL